MTDSWQHCAFAYTMDVLHKLPVTWHKFCTNYLSPDTTNQQWVSKRVKENVLVLLICDSCRSRSRSPFTLIRVSLLRWASLFRRPTWVNVSLLRLPSVSSDSISAKVAQHHKLNLLLSLVHYYYYNYTTTSLPPERGQNVMGLSSGLHKTAGYRSWDLSSTNHCWTLWNKTQWTISSNWSVLRQHRILRCKVYILNATAASTCIQWRI